MTGLFPAEDLDCPDPSGCPVAVDELTDIAAAGRLPQIDVPTDHDWYRVYDARDGYASPNPGFGDTRFAPFDDAEGVRVPTLYVADSLAAALLESSLHDVAVQTPRLVAETALLGKHHARLVQPSSLRLADMRDPALKSLGIPRDAISSSSEEHYPCTRRIALAVHSGPQQVRGILWHSRQAELNGQSAAEIAVLFGDRIPTHRGAWTLAHQPQASGALLEGHGRLLLDRLAVELGVTILDEGLSRVHGD